jgi:2',3'-cyclic-nucleotide 2'-phosphodiesterase (5'-nucleotidase family)
VSTVGLAAVSGIRVRLDRTKPPGERVVSAILLDGSVVDDAKLYSVATNDFVLAGGDGYEEFSKGTSIIDTGVFLRDILVAYIKTRRILSPKLDGRIVVNN